MDLIVLLKNSFRNLFRHKFYSLLNITGFAFGITIFFLVSIYVFEHSIVDRFNGPKENVYRLEMGEWAITGTFQGPYIKEHIPAVEQFLRIDCNWLQQADMMHEGQLYNLPDVIMADSTFFEFFPATFIKGSELSALKEPNSIVFTRSQAEVVFGTVDVIGEVVTLQGKINAKITAVIEDVHYSHLPIKAIVPFVLMKELSTNPNVLNVFGMWNYFTFLKLNPQAEWKEVGRDIKILLNDYVKSHGKEIELDYFLRPFHEIYFADHIAYEPPIKHGSKSTIRAFMLIALFVLFIAIINFMNMSTARAFTRAREVGVRKLLGSTRRSLLLQFLTESVITTSLAIVLSFFMVIFILPYFNAFAGISFSPSNIGWPVIIVIILLSVIIVGFLSGTYPAFYLTAFQPVAVLKGQKTHGRKGLLLRKGLTVFQFAISIALIAATLIVLNQIDFMKNRDLGFDRESVIYFRVNSSEHKESMRNMILENPDVSDVSFSNSIPGSVSWQETAEVNGERKQFTYWPVHASYLNFLNVKPVAGRTFDENLRSEMENVILINETGVNFFGLKGTYEEIIGQQLKEKRIIGIIPDFHYNSVGKSIAPLVVVWNERNSKMASVKVRGDNHQEVVGFLKNVYSSFYPDRYFRYYFLDETYDENYQGVEKLGKIMIWFSAFAVFISCLGLFGLASFMAERRTREVSVRKIVGAGIFRIYFLLLKDFMKLFIAGLILAIPLVWYLMNSWLDNFAFHLDITPVPFIMGGVIALLITLATISFHSIKISRLNPAQALKYE